MNLYDILKFYIVDTLYTYTLLILVDIY